MPEITDLAIAIKLITALYHEGLVNKATYEKVMLKYGNEAA